MSSAPPPGARSLRDTPGPVLLVLTSTVLLTFQGGALRLALPVIRTDLQTGATGIQLISLAALVVVTTTLVSFGRLADLAGPRRVYALGLAVFATGGVLVAGAPGTAALVTALAVQGIGWSMCAGSGPALVVTAVPGGHRGRVLAAFHMAVAVGLGAGPAVGGLIIDGLGWRVALGAGAGIALPLAVALARRGGEDVPTGTGSSRSFDVVGALLLALSIGGLLVLLRSGTRAPLVDGPAAAVAVIGLLALGRREHVSSDPMLDPGLLRHRRFAAALAASWLTFVAMASNMFLMPFVLQDQRGHSPSAAGAILATVPLAILLVAPLAGRATDRVGPRLPATLGLGLLTAGIALMATIGADSPTPWVVAVLAVYGAGAALFQSPNITGALSAAGETHVGVASGTLSTVGRLGQVTGIAVAGGLTGDVLADPDTTLAMASTLRGAFLVLAGVAAAATVASWARGHAPPGTTVPPAVAPVSDAGAPRG